MENIIKDIPRYSDFVKIEHLNKGCGGDTKYYIEKSNGEKQLIRVTGISEYDRKKIEFEMMKCASDTGVPMSIPVDFGICNGGMRVYSIFTWCEGEDVDMVLSNLSEDKQYALGLEAGEILRKINSIPAPATQEDWAVKFARRAKNIIQRYRSGSVKIDGGEKIIEYIENNRHLLEKRNQYFLHTDYHTGNIIIDKNYKLKIIDFSDYDFGDPYIEFVHMYWCSMHHPKFAVGCIDGYFKGKPPELFFRLWACYVAAHALTSLYCANINDQEDMSVALKESAYLLRCSDNMTNPAPTWYV